MSDNNQKSVDELSLEDILEDSDPDFIALKNEANALFAAGDYEGSIKLYTKGLKLYSNHPTNRATLLKNRAAAYLKLEEYESVISDTTAALDITKGDVKALFRRCQAYEKLKRYSEAYEDALAVNHLDQNISEIQPLLSRLSAKMQKITALQIDEPEHTEKYAPGSVKGCKFVGWPVYTAMFVIMFIPAVSMITIGSIYFHSCPLRTFVPVYLLIGGVLLIITTLMFSLHATECGKALPEKFICGYAIIEFILLAFQVLWYGAGFFVIDHVKEEEVEYDDKNSEYYCNKTLFTFYKCIILIPFCIGAVIILCTCTAGAGKYIRR